MRSRPKGRTLEERFFAMVEKTDDCWLWTGFRRPKGGYGAFRATADKTYAAHRWSYEFLVGPIPDGLTIDHLCRNPPCVNPAHLEPVTIQENIARVPKWARSRTRGTHCSRGHELPANRQPSQACTTCDREKQAEYRAQVSAGLRVVQRKSSDTLATHCKAGHEFSAENTYMRPNGRRDCRQCRRAERIARTQRRRQAKQSAPT